MSQNTQFILPSLGENKHLRFASIGECMIEMAPSEKASEFRLGFAGDTFNTAWYMRVLRPDISTRYITCVGKDEASQNMLNMMEGAGIDTSHIAQSDTSTVGLYLISLTDGERSFSYWRETSAARTLGNNPKAISDAIKDADLVYFSGISLAILDKDGRQNLISCLQQARSNGKIIAFDSNLRPRLWSDTSEMMNTVMQAAAISNIVLPSYDDEATYFKDADIAATAQRYLDVGAKTVVVKNGGGSVYYVHEGSKGHVSTRAAEHIVDTTSAGDSFNAGFFAGLDSGNSIEELIQNASQVAGQVIGRKGALVDLDLKNLTCFEANKT